MGMTEEKTHVESDLGTMKGEEKRGEKMTVHEKTETNEEMTTNVRRKREKKSTKKNEEMTIEGKKKRDDFRRHVPRTIVLKKSAEMTTDERMKKEKTNDW